jgi:hypothetical protein
MYFFPEDGPAVKVNSMQVQQARVRSHPAMEAAANRSAQLMFTTRGLR